MGSCPACGRPEWAPGSSSPGRPQPLQASGAVSSGWALSVLPITAEYIERHAVISLSCFQTGPLPQNSPSLWHAPCHLCLSTRGRVPAMAPSPETLTEAHVPPGHAESEAGAQGHLGPRDAHACSNLRALASALCHSSLGELSHLVYLFKCLASSPPPSLENSELRTCVCAS